MSQVETEAGSFTIFLGVEEGFEDAGQGLIHYAGAGIQNCKHDVIAGVRASASQNLTLINRKISCLDGRPLG